MMNSAQPRWVSLFLFFIINVSVLFNTNTLYAQTTSPHLPDPSRSIKVIFYAPTDKALINNLIYDIWNEALNVMNLSSTTLQTTDKAQALQWFAEGKGEVLVGPLQYNDVPSNDYMNNYLTITTGVVINSHVTAIYWEKLIAILDLIFSKSVLVLIVGLLIAALFICIIERRQLTSPFHGDLKQSLWRAIWFQATTFTTVAYGDIVPTSKLGQLFTVVMQYLFLFLLAAFTASVTAELTVLKVQTKQLYSLAQLSDKKVAYLVDSPEARRDITHYYAIPFPCKSMEDLFAKVANNQVAAAFADRLELRRYLKLHPEADIFLTRFEIPQSGYVFVIQHGHALAIPMTMALYQLNAKGTIEKLIDNYVGADRSARMSG